MNKVFKVLTISPTSKVEVVTVTAKNNKDLKRRLELRNYQIKQILGEA